MDVFLQTRAAFVARFGSRRLVVTMVALRELQRCVTMDVTVSSTQSLMRLSARVVQQQDLGVQSRLKGLPIAGTRSLVVALVIP